MNPWRDAPRFFVAAGAIRPRPEARGVVRGAEAHHALRVLRLGPGAPVVLLDGGGLEYRGWIAAARLAGGEPEFVVEELEAVRSPAEPGFPLHLLQALPKGDKFEYVVQKGTEVGVTSFWPVRTERVVISFDPEKASARRERWQRIAAEAAKQARRAVIPEVAAPLSLEAAAGQLRSRGVELIVLWEQATVPLKAALRALAAGGPAGGDGDGAGTGAPRAGIALVVGPEGGLASREVEMLVELGARAASLGPRVLRTETAGAVAAALVLYELDTTPGGTGELP